jgi:glycosyltransferase involved in cell wall biosynthesis
MHFGLPVVAFAAGAVPDTLGSGGVLVGEKKHAEIGQLLGDIASSGELRERLIKNGRERVEYFSFERFAARVRDLLTRSSGAGTMVEGL